MPDARGTGYQVPVRVDPRGAVTGSAAATKALDSVGAAATTARRLVRGMVLSMGGLTGAVGAAFAVNQIAQFEDRMAAVKAVTGATGNQFRQLSSLTRRLGATTVFTARQASDAALFLSRAGFKTTETLQSLRQVLLLARAGGLELADAGQITADSLRGFGLAAGEAGRVANTLALASARANTTVQELGHGIKFVAPVAAAFNVSLETTVAALSKLSDAGLKATIAGTSLRRILSGLAQPTGPAVKTLSALGIAVSDLSVGTNGLIPVLRRLKQAGIGGAEAFKLFGQRGGPGFLILKELVPQLEELEQELIANRVAAQQMANIMDDTLLASMKAFVSAASESILIIGDKGLRGATRDLLTTATGVLSVWNNMTDEFALGNQLTADQADGFERLAGTVKGLAAAIAGLATAPALFLVGRLLFGGRTLGEGQGKSKGLIRGIGALARLNPIVTTLSIAGGVLAGVLAKAESSAERFESAIKSARSRVDRLQEGVGRRNFLEGRFHNPSDPRDAANRQFTATRAARDAGNALSGADELFKELTSEVQEFVGASAFLRDEFRSYSNDVSQQFADLADAEVNAMIAVQQAIHGLPEAAKQGEDAVIALNAQIANLLFGEGGQGGAGGKVFESVLQRNLIGADTPRAQAAAQKAAEKARANFLDVFAEFFIPSTANLQNTRNVGEAYYVASENRRIADASTRTGAANTVRKAPSLPGEFAFVDYVQKALGEAQSITDKIVEDANRHAILSRGGGGRQLARENAAFDQQLLVDTLGGVATPTRPLVDTPDGVAIPASQGGISYSFDALQKQIDEARVQLADALADIKDPKERQRTADAQNARIGAAQTFVNELPETVGAYGDAKEQGYAQEYIRQADNDYRALVGSLDAAQEASQRLADAERLLHDASFELAGTEADRQQALELIKQSLDETINPITALIAAEQKEVEIMNASADAARNLIALRDVEELQLQNIITLKDLDVQATTEQLALARKAVDIASEKNNLRSELGVQGGDDTRAQAASELLNDGEITQAQYNIIAAQERLREGLEDPSPFQTFKDGFTTAFDEVNQYSGKLTQTIGKDVGGALNTIGKGVANSAAEVAVYGGNFKEAFGNTAREALKQLTAALINYAIQLAIVRALGGGPALSGGGNVSNGSGGNGGGVGPGAGGRASGGYVYGPGTSTSDSILARLSDGEFVVNAASTKRYAPLLEAINNAPKYADGGLVSATRAGDTPIAAGGVNVTINNETGVDATAEARQDELSGNIVITMRDAIASGEIDNDLGRSFGVNRIPR